MLALERAAISVVELETNPTLALHEWMSHWQKKNMFTHFGLGAAFRNTGLRICKSIVHEFGHSAERMDLHILLLIIPIRFLRRFFDR